LYNSWKSRAAGIAIAAMMVVPTLSLASVSGAAGNNDNATACQQGGFVNQAASSGARFKNAGECTSYAAKGTALVALPDLVPEATCTTPSPLSAICSFYIRNIGAASASNVPFRQDDPHIFTVSGPIGPGESVLAETLNYGSGVAGPVTFTFVIDPNNVIAEGNETNNTLSVTVTLTP